LRELKLITYDANLNTLDYKNNLVVIFVVFGAIINKLTPKLRRHLSFKNEVSDSGKRKTDG